MNWLKTKFQWLKENLWLPLSAAVVLLASLLLFRRGDKGVIDTLNKNRLLQNEETKVIEEANKNLTKKAAEVNKKTREKLKKLKVGRVKRTKKQQEELRNKIDELASKSNEELAELLKKADEV
jgi:flagellar biosynthesis/type III secretory pathway M-ring protein FliF/YscJ